MQPDFLEINDQMVLRARVQPLLSIAVRCNRFLL
jgi:hypothetical protein